MHAVGFFFSNTFFEKDIYKGYLTEVESREEQEEEEWEKNEEESHLKLSGVPIQFGAEEGDWGSAARLAGTDSSLP